MLLDSQEVFCTAQAPTAVADTASTNIYDTLGLQDDGAGENMWLVIRTDAVPTSAGAPTIQFVLQTAADAAFTTPVDMLVSKSYLKADAAFVAGSQLLAWRVPTGDLRYLRLVFRIGTAVLTAGAWSAFFVKDAQFAPIQSAAGYTVA